MCLVSKACSASALLVSDLNKELRFRSQQRMSTLSAAGLGVLGATYPPDPVQVFGDGNVKGKYSLQTRHPCDWWCMHSCLACFKFYMQVSPHA